MWEPTASVDALKVAVPLVSDTDFSVVVPSMKLTFPVAAPAVAPPAETVAVKVTDCPNTDGLGEEATLVAVVALLTTCVTAVAEVLPPKLASPE